MADPKSKTAKQDEGKTEEPAVVPAPETPKQEPPATEQDAGTPAPATDTPPKEPNEEPPPSELTVLILRAERVGKTDYQPGATPTLPYDEAQRLIKRGGADANEKAVRAAKAARNKG